MSDDGSARERVAFDECLKRWVVRYGVESVRATASPVKDGDAKADLVVVRRGFENTPGWRAYLRALAMVTGKILIVAIPNGGHWRARVGHSFRSHAAHDPCTVETLAPVLWEIGRVRERVFYDAPRWSRKLEKDKGRLGPLLAHRQAFVVDVSPRSPQAKRRLTRAP